MSVWDTFPEPTEEAKQWTPDADSIARPGTLRDPRFDRYATIERYHKRVLAQSHMIHRMGSGSGSRASNQSQASEQTAKSSTLRQGLAGWPAQTKRTSGQSRDTYGQPMSPAMRAMEARTAPISPSVAKSSSAIKSSKNDTFTTVKGTVDDFFGELTSESPPKQAPTMHRSSESSSSAKEDFPPWAAIMERLLKEDKAKSRIKPIDASDIAALAPDGGKEESAPIAKVVVSAPTRAIALNPLAPSFWPASSINTNKVEMKNLGIFIKEKDAKDVTKDKLVKKFIVEKDDVKTVTVDGKDVKKALATERDVKEVTNKEKDIEEVVREDEYHRASEALAWKLAMEDHDITDAKEGLRAQEKAFSSRHSPTQTIESTGASSPCRDVKFKQTAAAEYDRYIAVLAIGMMEAEMDLPDRYQKSELFAMADDEFDTCISKVTSAHQNWWMAEYAQDSGDDDN